MDRHKVTLLSKVHACTGLTLSYEHHTWASRNGVCLICGERVVLWLVRWVLNVWFTCQARSDFWYGLVGSKPEKNYIRCHTILNYFLTHIIFTLIK